VAQKHPEFRRRLADPECGLPAFIAAFEEILRTVRASLDGEAAQECPDEEVRR
jgi:hypothetical protein